MSTRRWSLVLLAAVHLALAAAGYLAPYDPAEQHRAWPNVPPVRPHLFDASGTFAGPFVYGLTPLGNWGGYKEDPAKRYPIHFLTQGRLWAAGPDAPAFLLGTDELGRDQLSRLLHGGRISLAAGLLAAALSILCGISLGMLAGYREGLAQTLILRGAELSLALPWLYFLLGVRATLPLALQPESTFLLLSAAIGCIGWARPAVLACAATRVARHRDWVRVAQSFGASRMHILRRHILPELLPIALAQAVILIPRYVLAEVTLSYLGLGIHDPGVSWGTMLAAARQLPVLVSEWWLALPCAAVAIVFQVYQFAARAWEDRAFGYTEGNAGRPDRSVAVGGHTSAAPHSPTMGEG